MPDVIIHDGPIQGAWGICGRFEEDSKGRRWSMGPDESALLDELRNIAPGKKVPPEWPDNVVTGWYESEPAGECRDYLKERLLMNFEDFAESVSHKGWD